MSTLEQQVGATQQAFEELAAQGREWVELDEVARRAMRSQREHRHQRRSRMANSTADLFLSDGTGRTEERIPFRYRHQTQIAASDLEAAGKIEHRFLDDEGRLRKDPPGRRDYRDRRYRLVPEMVEGAEVSPQDRFEKVARRIEALSGVAVEGEGDDAVTAVSAELRTPRNPTWPRATTVDLRIAYLPSRDGATEREPQSIAASWTAPLTDGSTGSREEHLAASRLVDDYETGYLLGMLEDSVRAVELTELGSRTDEGVRQLLLKTFTSEPMEVREGNAATPPAIRRDPGTYIM